MKEKSDEFNKHLEVVEASLTKHISLYFDKFTLAFESFDDMKGDLASISQQTKLSKSCIKQLKEDSVQGMLLLYHL